MAHYNTQRLLRCQTAVGLQPATSTTLLVHPPTQRTRQQLPALHLSSQNKFFGKPLPQALTGARAKRRSGPCGSNGGAGGLSSAPGAGAAPRCDAAGAVAEEAGEGERLLRPQSLTIPVGDRQIVIETGRLGRLAGGAVTVTDGETVVYCTACADIEASDVGDFAPLTVNYHEKFSAAGRTSGGYIKREGRPKDHEVLVSRLIDRPLRPMMAKGFSYETQVLSWVLSYDEEHSPDALSIVAAGAALAVSDIPMAGVVAGVRVGLVEGEGFVVNPTVAQQKRSKLDLVVAGTQQSVLMIEGYCDFLSEEQLLEAVAVGHAAIADICQAILQWADGQNVGKPKRSGKLQKPPQELDSVIAELVGAELEAALRINQKRKRGEAVGAVEEKVFSQLTAEGRAKATAAAADAAVAAAAAAAAAPAATAAVAQKKKKTLLEEEEEEWDEEEGIVVPDGNVDEGEVHIGRAVAAGPAAEDVAGSALGVEERDGPLSDMEVAAMRISSVALDVSAAGSATDAPQTYSVADVKRALKELSSKTLRRIIVMEGVRSDGRNVTQVRPIESSCGLLPRTHGSALFTRGETQALAVTTLGGDDVAQRLDHLTAVNEYKRFYLHYNFPPSSVGETGRVGFASRREIGHGTLAERALEPALPPADTFPYAIRLESNITESNGSSSMASVCGGCLSLLDAGVPLACNVAGVAMGLILDTRDVGGTGEPVILTDILGSEDALGDMDFKVAGNETDITAFQMDIKVTGITIDILRDALAQAREGRVQVLNAMAKCDPPPRRQLSNYAPRFATMKIGPDKVNVVIGSGGKTIRGIIEDTGVESINVEDTGELKIFAKSEAALLAAQARIEGLTMEPEVGKIYRNCAVKSLQPYGCFVELAPGKEGLVHISELQIGRVENTEDAVSVGDVIDVKLLEINARGQLRLSRKAVLLEEQQEQAGQQSNGTVAPLAPPTSAAPAAVKAAIPAAADPKPPAAAPASAAAASGSQLPKRRRPTKA